jgi:hypothetical protein
MYNLEANPTENDGKTGINYKNFGIMGVIQMTAA